MRSLYCRYTAYAAVYTPWHCRYTPLWSGHPQKILDPPLGLLPHYNTQSSTGGDLTLQGLVTRLLLGDCVATQSPIVCTQVAQIFSCSCCFFCCLFIFFFFFLPVHILASIQEWVFTPIQQSEKERERKRERERETLATARERERPQPQCERERESEREALATVHQTLASNIT